MQNTHKKPYSAPQLREQGSVVEKTKGLFGWSWESWGQFVCEGDPIKPPPRDG